MPGGVKDFKAQLQGFKERRDARLTRVLQMLASELAQNIIVGGDVSPGTPVDTGFARASWWISVNSAGSAPNQIVVGDEVLPAPLSEVELAVLGAKAGDTIYLLNNAQYIEDLERGTSTQAPAGFVRLTVAQAQFLLDRIVSRIINGGT